MLNSENLNGVRCAWVHFTALNNHNAVFKKKKAAPSALLMHSSAHTLNQHTSFSLSGLQDKFKKGKKTKTRGARLRQNSSMLILFHTVASVALRCLIWVQRGWIIYRWRCEKQLLRLWVPATSGGVGWEPVRQVCRSRSRRCFCFAPTMSRQQTKKRFMNFTVQKKKRKKVCSFAENSAAAGQKRGEIINAPSSGGRSEHRKHLHWSKWLKSQKIFLTWSQ